MTARSNRTEVRNPVLALPGFIKIQTLPRPVRETLADDGTMGRH